MNPTTRLLAAVTACAMLLPFCTACGKTSYDPDYKPFHSVDVPDASSVIEETSAQPEGSEEGQEQPETEALPVDTDAPAELTPDEVNVRPAAWADVQWTLYQCQYFTVEIPEGWEVEWKGNAEQLIWTARAPEGTYAGVNNIDHMTICKTQQTAGMLGQPIWLENGTVQEYFEKIYSDTTENFTVHNSCVPANKDELQALRSDKAIWDYQAMYATFYDKAAGCDGEGIYSAVVMEAPDLVLTGGINYAMWEINCTLSQWAEPGRLVDWAPVLAHICQTFTYTDYYIQEWMAIYNAQFTQSSPAGDTDPVMEAYEERSREETIRMEKYSDMIGEYERVYDNETGDIYRAYNGFLDDMGDQNRYSSITDNQYADGYVGWIDKD